MDVHFNYAAREPGGVRVWGEIVASNIEQALKTLQETGVCVTKIEPVPASRRKRGWAGRVGLSAKEKSLLVQSWACLLESGFSMDAALSQLQSHAQHPSVRRVLCDAQQLIRGGMTLAEAVRASGLLPPSWAAVLEAGEKRGDLGRSMRVLKERNDQMRKTVREVVSILLMPVVLIALVFVWFWVFTGLLLPAMAQTAMDMTGASNPLLVGLKGLAAMMVPAAIGVAGILGFSILALFRGNQSNGLMDPVPAWVPVRFPFIGPLISKVHLIVVASEFQLQLEAGIPILTALHTLSLSAPKQTLRKELTRARLEISNGVPEWQAIGDLGIIPAQALPLLAAGQACGKFPELLGVLVREASLDLETEAYRIAIKMRTCAVVMAGIIVGILAVSVMAILSYAFGNIAR